MSRKPFHNQRIPRRGTTLVLLVLCMIPLIGFVALSIDMGLLAVARTQAQDAADAAAMAGVRTLNGDATNNNNYSQVSGSSLATLAGKDLLGSSLASSQLTLQVGRYTYDVNNQRFEGIFPGPSNENWSLVRATVTADVNAKMSFSRIFNFTLPNLRTSAAAVHRPRDVAVIMDFSGSMRFSSQLATPFFGTRTTINTADPIVPLFGGYSAAVMTAPGHTMPFGEANYTRTTNDGRPPIVTDFYSNGSGAAAWMAAPAAYATTPAGDNYLRQNLNTGATYAQTVAAVLNLGLVGNGTRDANWETQGYTRSGMRATFDGYTQGPSYWGKSFFIWPPDARPALDWRKRFFVYPGTATPMDDNSRLWDVSGNWRAPGATTYGINYTAILAWIKSGPNPFPASLQSGRILYYDAIPDTINTAVYPPANLNERFWKDYIDYSLGVRQDSASAWAVVCNGSTALTGLGRDFAWGPVRITPKASLTGVPAPYMRYDDNPRRPRLHFWFGPYSMVDFLGNYNAWGAATPYGSRFCWWPGTCHESPLYACKLGIRAALFDIKDNHPNDLVSTIFFSVPKTSASTNDGGRFNRGRVGLGRDYDRMNEALWYPPSTLGNSNATVRPYDARNLECPRAYGGTCYAMPLMLAYNQFSGNTSLRTYNSAEPPGDAGGNGRKGAQKIVIFETDGAPNTSAAAVWVSGGTANSYYRVRYNSGSPSASDFPTGVSGYSDNNLTVVGQIKTVCQKICALEGAGGYSTASKPVLIHCIGFGDAFDPGTPGANQNRDTLNQMQLIGSVTDGMPAYKIVNGDEQSMVTSLQQAFTKIMQSGVQVSLIH